jgi:hypothetical protein
MSGPDYLSDADAEAMDRARDPMDWARIDDAAEAHPIAADMRRLGTHHNALDDARDQAAHAMEIFKQHQLSSVAMDRFK